MSLNLMKWIRFLLAGSLCLVLVSACGTADRARRLFGGQLTLQVDVAPDANRDSPIAVDLLVVYDEDLVDLLTTLDATAYFSQRRQIRRDRPDDFDWWSYEWVPGQQTQRLQLSFSSGARAAIVFAHYGTPGQHRARLDPRTPRRLVLGTERFDVLPYDD